MEAWNQDYDFHFNYSFTGCIILFFFVRWWIPVLLILIAIPLPNAIRKEAAKAVLSYSLKDEKFYERAIFSQTLKLFRKKEGKMKNP
ncbi:MAG: hypothetical protein ACK5OO_11085 [Cyclobacteriaceae bacterium]